MYGYLHDLEWWDAIASFSSPPAADLAMRQRGPQNREIKHRCFYALMGFAARFENVFLISTGMILQDRDNALFDERESWLTEHCPSFTRLGPLIGIQDEDEAFAFKLRFG